VAVDQVSVLVKNQLKSTLDESFDQVALSQAKLLLIQAQSGVQEAEAALSTALGFQDAQHFTLTEVPLNLDLPDSADNLVQLGLNQRPELAALRHEVDAAHVSLKPNKLRNIPRLQR